MSQRCSLDFLSRMARKQLLPVFFMRFGIRAFLPVHPILGYYQLQCTDEVADSSWASSCSLAVAGPCVFPAFLGPPGVGDRLRPGRLAGSLMSQVAKKIL